MKLSPSDTLWPPIVAAFLLFSSTASISSGAEPVRPTPRPGSLASYAENKTLDLTVLDTLEGRVILTNDTIANLAVDGSITLGAVKHSGPETTTSVADKTERSRWQAAHGRQREVIADLERRRSRLELEIDQIKDLSLTAKTMARLEQSEAKLRLLDREIATERAELARIVRNARRQGAEPGWFR